jgi:chaperone required for assembly of F1-ATPase
MSSANDNTPAASPERVPTSTQAPDVGGGDRVGLGKEAVRPPLPKRFYAAASVTQAAAGGYAVLLDGRGVKTPKKSAILLPSRALADLIAVEWNAQGERIDPATMPLTRLANTTLDAVTAHAREVAADIVAFTGTDALCYRAEAPTDLVRLQAEAYDPVLEWARDTLGAELATQTGVVPIMQPPQSLAAIARVVEAYTPWQLAPIHVMTTLTGSAVLALAVAHRHTSVAQAWRIAHIDEDWQIARWGSDDEANVRRANRERDMVAAWCFLETVF